MEFDWIDPAGRNLSIDNAEPIIAEITELRSRHDSGIENHLPDVTLQLIASRFDAQVDQLRRFYFTYFSALITELPNFIKTSGLRLAWWQENVGNVMPPQKDVAPRAMSSAQLSIFDAGSNSAMPIDWFEAYSCLQEMSEYRLPTDDQMESAITSLEFLIKLSTYLQGRFETLKSEKAQGSNAIPILNDINDAVAMRNTKMDAFEEIIK